jgi:hypothetical protein
MRNIHFINFVFFLSDINIIAFCIYCKDEQWRKRVQKKSDERACIIVGKSNEQYRKNKKINHPIYKVVYYIEKG